MIFGRFKSFWTSFWMRFAGLSRAGRVAMWLATWFVPPFSGRCILARMNKRGYVSWSATVYHNNLILGDNIFIGDRVIIYKDSEGGPVELGKRVHLYGDTCIQTGQGGSLTIGENTHIQPNCQFSAYKGSIHIGKEVQIAPHCAFYPYDHSFSAGELIARQPLTTKGGIVVGDGAWLGFGVIVLDGVRIGKGAVVGAGAVVSRDIPDGAVAAGAPAEVIKMRSAPSNIENGKTNGKK